MALSANKMRIPDNIPPGNFASKLIRAVNRDSKHTVFPKYALYAGSIREKSLKEEGMEDVKVYLPLEHPLEGRNNPQPSKGFMDWKVPTRFSAELSSRGSSRPVTRQIKTSGSSRHHGLTQTTHFAPPHGKFEPIKSEQQEHMAEVLKRENAIQQSIKEKESRFPKLAKSAPIRKRGETPLTLEPRTYSAAQRWLKRNPGEEELARKVLRQTSRSEVDHLLENTMEPNAKRAVRDWLKTASEGERQAALKFFRSIAGARLLGGPSGSHAESNNEGDRDARLRAVLNALSETQAPPAHFHSTMDHNIKHLMKAAHRRHIRLLTPNTRTRHNEFQTWHHMPMYPIRGRADNILSMYTKPGYPSPRDFRIHPEWGA